MIVLDASALVDLLVDVARGPRIEWLLRDEAIAAPELIHVETASTFWRMERSGELTDSEARTALRQARELELTTIPHRGLLERVWEVREHVRIADAFYLAVAERVDGPLVTSDARLARGHHGVPVTLVT